jgi:glycosyltransferase involved in cell wall biosynthesis
VLGGGAFGDLCTPGDPSALAEAVCRSLADPERREHLVRRAGAAAASYDWALLTPRILDVYAAVVHGSREVVAG